MVKKLLFYKIVSIAAFLWLGAQGVYAQCPTSVGITYTPNSDICEGTSITFTANTTGGDDLQYQWQVNGTPQGPNEREFTPTSLINGQVVAVIVTSNAEGNEGCSKTSEVPVTINPNRTVDVIIAADISTICPGGTVIFTIATQNNIGSGSTYEWRVNGTSQGSTNTFTSSSLIQGDKVQLWVDSSVPCTQPKLSNEVIIMEKPGQPALPVSITGKISVCPGETALLYEIDPVTNATSYEWQLPTGWSGSSTATSITVTAGNTGNATIKVRAKNECGNSEFQTLDVTVRDAAPSQPAAITGPAFVCPGVTADYSIAAVAHATGYLWTLPDGITTQTTSEPKISITSSTSGSSNISVQATNDCGTSTKRTLNVSLKPGKPATPAAITGSAAVCPGISQTYNVAAVTGATSYLWSLPSGWSGTSTSRSISVTTGTTGGKISVIARNECADSEVSELTVTVNAGTPEMPVFVSPLTDVCPAEANIFTVADVPGASGYIWTLPSGWSGSSTTNSISITSANSGTGSISVQATNSCGTSAKKTIPVAIKPPKPVMTGIIEGPSNVCASTSTGIQFSIPEVQYADENKYEWTVTGDWEITGGNGSRTITVTSGTATGTISVKANNDCGESVAATKNITVTTGVPGQPGTITSSLGNNQNICPPLSEITFTVPAVSGATGYEWVLPDGWEITDNENTRSITVRVTANAPYKDENVSVRAINSCGKSAPSTFTNITVSNFIVTNLGGDRIVCNTTDDIHIDVEMRFGTSKKLVPSFSTSGTGTFDGVPTVTGQGNNNIPNNFTIRYRPSTNDLTEEFVLITFTVPKPNGENPCGQGKDEMKIYFRGLPTASITTPSAICTGTSTNLTVTGTPNSRVTYSKGTQTGLTVDIGSSGTATIESEILATTTIFKLTGITNTDAPTCSNTLDSSATVTVTQIPTAEISYTGPFCNSDDTTQTPTLSGTNSYSGGTYSATGDLGAKITSGTGAFIPSDVEPGTYTVTYTTPASGGCEAVTATAEVTITPLPTAAIFYDDSPFCSIDSSDKLVTLTGTNAYTGGTYSSSAGLDIHPSTGVIKAAMSDPGTYTVTYTLPAASGCGVVTATTDVTITEIPAPSISYSQNAVCNEDLDSYSPTIAGTGIVADGNFSAPTGLSMTSAGVITPSASSPGTFKVLYTLAPASGCGEITAETDITITAVPSVEISYAGPFCESTTGSKPVNFTNGIGAYENGSFAVSPAGLTIDAATGAIVPSSSTDGEYTITYTIPSSAGGSTKTAETTVNITAVPKATLSYSSSKFCSTDEASYTVAYSDTEGNYESGTFSGTSGLVIDASTGTITPNGSTAGLHTVTYTIATTDGCEAVTSTVEIEIIKPIEITAQPSNVGKCAGETARLEVVATGKDLTYQWYQDGAPVPGATSSILEYSPVDSDDDGIYYVEISGSAPCSLVTSETATLIVDQNIEVNSTPEAKELCVGDSTSFSVDAAASGGAILYQWIRDGEELIGENESSIVLDNISLEDEGEYSVFLEGPGGFTCSTITYTAGTLDVFEKPVPNAGNNITSCYSAGSITITDGASIEHASSVLWTTDGTGSITNADSITEATYTPGTNETGEITITLTAFGNSTCASVESQKTLVIERLPVITSFSYSATEFCETDSEVKNPFIVGENAYQNGNFSVDPPTGLNITSDGKIDPSASGPGTYEITYSTPAGPYCGPVESDPFTLVIGLEPIANFSYDSGIYCRENRDANQNTDPVILLSEARGENFDSFNVINESGTVVTTSGLDLDATTGAINLSSSTAGDYFIQRTLNYTGEEEDGCIAITAVYPITITDKPIADFTYPSSEYCSDVTTNPIPQMADGAVSGTFSEKSGNTELVFTDTSTGEIDLASSSPGDYIIINTVEVADDACDPVDFEFSLSITRKSDATFAYTKQEFCITDEYAAVAEGFEPGGIFSSENNTLGDKLNPSTGNITWTFTDTNIAGSHTILYKNIGQGSCHDVEHTFTLNIDPIPQGGKLGFDTFGRMFAICENPGENYAVDLSLTESVGQVVAWKYRTSSATSWYDLEIDGELFTGTTIPADDLEDLIADGGMESMVFRVQLEGGGCSATVFSETGIVSVISSSLIEPTPVQVSDDVICIGDEITLSSSANYLNGPDIADGGAFGNSSITNHGWRIDNDPKGKFDSSANNTRPEKWKRANPREYSTADITSPYTIRENITWSSDGDAGFAIVSGDRSSTLETPVFNIDGIDQAILTFDQAYNLTPDATIRVEISTNGGNTYHEQALYERVGPISSGNFGNFSGGDLTSRPNNKIRVDLGNFMGQGNLRIRFSFIGTRVGDVWALDNVDIPDGPRNVSTVWTDDTDPNNPIEIGTSNTETWEPQNIGLNTFEVQRFIIYNSNGDECENSTPPVEVSVFVFDSYISNVTAQVECGYYSVPINASLINSEDESITSYPTPDGFIGEWQVEGPEDYIFEETHFQNSDGTVSNSKNPKAVFNPNQFGSFTLSWVLIQKDGREIICTNTFNPITFELRDIYSSSAEAQVGNCGDTSIQLSGEVNGALQGIISNFPTSDGVEGTWTVTGPSDYNFSSDHFADGNDIPGAINDPNATFTPGLEGEFTLRWSLTRNGEVIDSCLPEYTDVTFTLKNCTTLDFDGVDDYVDLGEGYTGDYSIEAWIRPEASTGTIISTPNLEINMSDLPAGIIPNSRWYHIAVDSDGKLYVDGIDARKTIDSPGSERAFIGARWNNSSGQPENYFSGWIEEVRIWKTKTPLTVEEIHMMMNQRLAIPKDELGVVIDPWTNFPDPGTPVDGEVVPVRNAMSYFQDTGNYNLYDLDGERWYDRTWGDLAGYYRLISKVPDPEENLVSNEYSPLNGKTPNFADVTNHGHLHNMETDQQNTSPVPYISGNDGEWSNTGTWLRPNVWDFPNSKSQGDSITWNIAQTHHNIFSGDRNITLLGLLVEENELTIMDPTTTSLHWDNSGKELRITHYLKLNGVIDMYGSSQLMQDPGSIIDANSSGSLEIDQQGTANSYNYNYWTSPVSRGPRTGEGNNSKHVPHMLTPVLKDGTEEIFKEIDFNYQYTWADGGLQAPIRISSYWLYKFHGEPNVYGQWRYIGPGIEGNFLSYLEVGEGWSMKGTSGSMAIEDRQNYTFKGMPNNGYFTLPIGAKENYLIGNPFPSALDADKFIHDNLDVIDGTLYFWSHFAGGDTHILKEYEGGYALYTTAGGVEPFANDERIDNTGNWGSLKPGQFVPVGQAFFVRTDNPAASVITFKNSQRKFQREEDLISVFLQQEEKIKVEKQTETRERIWFRFRSPAGYQRQLLVAADENTTDGFDRGYDARLIENNKDDMYWVAGDNKFVIQGVPHLKGDRVLALGVNTNKEGWMSISIDELQNIPDNKEIFVKDSETQLVHNLRESPYVVFYSGGKDEARFEIVFRDEFAQAQEPVSPDTGVRIQYHNSTREFVISNPHVVELYDAVLNNVLGQRVQVFGNIPDQEEAKLQVERFSPGVYFVKVRTAKGVLTDKIIIEE